jgi:hypothetical protein
MYAVPFNNTHKPGTYKYGQKGGIIFAMFTCPYCETTMSIGDKSHIIHHDGMVHPSVVCPKERCFHEFVKFEGFDGTVSP